MTLLGLFAVLAGLLLALWFLGLFGTLFLSLVGYDRPFDWASENIDSPISWRVVGLGAAYLVPGAFVALVLLGLGHLANGVRL